MLVDITQAVGGYLHDVFVGNLTIRGTTKDVTFDVTATPKSMTRLEGTAKATIKYADFGITIPQVPQVASVGETVGLHPGDAARFSARRCGGGDFGWHHDVRRYL